MTTQPTRKTTQPTPKDQLRLETSLGEPHRPVNQKPENDPDLYPAHCIFVTKDFCCDTEDSSAQKTLGVQEVSSEHKVLVSVFLI
jgi:hypothetical protein